MAQSNSITIFTQSIFISRPQFQSYCIAQFYKLYQVLIIRINQIGHLMHQSPNHHHLKTEALQKQPFKIVLTLKEALFLSKLLPLNYSLQYQRTKRGRRPLKRALKSNKRTNLPDSSKQRQMLTNPQDSNSQILPLIINPKEAHYHKQEVIPPLERQDTKSNQNQSQIQESNNTEATNQWMATFIKECDSVSIIKKAFGEAIKMLKERLQSKNIQQADFAQTVINLINIQTIKKTKRSIQLAERLKKIYAKHKNNSTNRRNNPSLQNQVNFLSNSKASKIKSPETKRKRKDTQSSQDLGFDINTIDFDKIKPKQQPIQYDTFFMNAAFISRNLRKIPNEQALRILNKYGIAVIDLLKIKSLPKYKLQELRIQVKDLKSQYPGKISDSQDDNKQYVQSSFEIEDD